MATKMLTSGAVQFGGRVVELHKPIMVNGRKGTPFMAWVRDGVTPDGFRSQPSTTVRVKWDTTSTYMPSDFSDQHGPKASFSEIEAVA